MSVWLLKPSCGALSIRFHPFCLYSSATTGPLSVVERKKKAHIIKKCRAGACGSATTEVRGQRVRKLWFGRESVVGECPSVFSQLGCHECVFHSFIRVKCFLTINSPRYTFSLPLLTKSPSDFQVSPLPTLARLSLFSFVDL